MFVSVHFPILDGRRLFERDVQTVLRSPEWPDPDPGSDFVRRLGRVVRRPRGGVQDWAGEWAFVDATRAIRLDPGDGNRPKCAYRRVYVDGLASARFEIGLQYPSLLQDPFRGVAASPEDVLDAALRKRVGILDLPALRDRRKPPPRIHCALREAGQPLADFWARTTTARPRQPSELVVPGKPLVIVEQRCGEAAPRNAVELRPFRDRGGTSDDFLDRETTVWAKWLEQPGSTRVLVWMLDDGAAAPGQRRELRIHLTRIHQEREALRQVCRWALAEKAVPTTLLEPFLERATRFLNRGTIHGFGVSPTLSAAYGADAFINVGEFPRLAHQLEVVRPEVRKRVQRTLEVPIFEAKWYEAHLDVARLATELARLCEAAGAASHPQPEEAGVDCVERAQEAATKGDGPGALRYLAKAGRWLFNLAEEIGVNVAAGAVKVALGI